MVRKMTDVEEWNSARLSHGKSVWNIELTTLRFTVWANKQQNYR